MLLTLTIYCYTKELKANIYYCYVTCESHSVTWFTSVALLLRVYNVIEEIIFLSGTKHRFFFSLSLSLILSHSYFDLSISFYSSYFPSSAVFKIGLAHSCSVTVDDAPQMYIQSAYYRWVGNVQWSRLPGEHRSQRACMRDSYYSKLVFSVWIFLPFAPSQRSNLLFFFFPFLFTW